MKQPWVPIQFPLDTPYLKIGKGSVVVIENVTYIVKRIDSIILLNEAVGKEGTVNVYARGIAREN